MIDLSVIVATYNRVPLLQRLLQQLQTQTYDHSRREVVVCDDGGTEEAARALAALEPRGRVVVLRQPNQGPAAARHRAIERAQGWLLVIVDDDMQVQPTFLEEHAKLHATGSPRAVLGRLAPDAQIATMPYFERWYAAGHQRTAARARAGTLALDGYGFYTGNASLRRDDYLKVGGFDLTLRLGEDTDLGLRLERAGVELVYCDAAVAFHGSDHRSEANWLEKARAYGAAFHAIGQKHADLPHAHPFRYLFEMNPAARPLIAAPLLAPRACRPLIAGVRALARRLWELELEGLAQPTTSALYTLELMRGVRSQLGPLSDTARALLWHWLGRARR